MAPPETTNKPLMLRMVVDVALALHLAAAAGYWWLTPKGFPADSSRFWLNAVLPIALIAIAFAGLIAMHRRQWSIAAVVVLYFASTWFAGAVSGRTVFPVSLRGIWLLAVIVAAAGFLCFFGLIRGEPRSYRHWFLSATAATLLGMFAIWANIPMAASTKPINVQPPQVVVQEPVSGSILRPGAGYEFDPVAAELTMSTGRVQIGCLPILDFERISPDRFWSLFAPARKDYRVPTANEIGDGAQTIRYSDNSVVVLSAPAPDGSLRLTAFTPVQQDTFSHLNTYCYFQIGGHKRLSLTFSPCPKDEIEVLAADYPTGRPARFAYFDSSNQFCVAEASSAEKGPFRQLAVGDLERGQPLTITVRDEGRPVAWITLQDWSQQVSTDLSPTAGWSVPVNAIEFRRLDDDATAPAAIWITLAATPVGRGWDTVGHQAGVYRNSVVFRPNAPEEAETK
jgi:hypothetical protein